MLGAAWNVGDSAGLWIGELAIGTSGLSRHAGQGQCT